jgi:hypothetical protein
MLVIPGDAWVPHAGAPEATSLAKASASAVRGCDR